MREHETPAEEWDDVSDPAEARLGQLPVILAALGDLAFTGTVAVHVAFVDTSPAAAIAVTTSAVVFVVSTIVALVAKRKSVVTIAAALIVVSGLAAAVAAVGAGRRYGALRDEVSIHRVGQQRLLEPDAGHGRRVGGAMLSSISASFAAMTALPLAGYLAIRIRRSPDRKP